MEFTDLAPGYFAMFAEAAITSPIETTEIAQRIAVHKDRYTAVEELTLNLGRKVPWFVVGIIHSLECDLDFTQHLFNGDPLTARTVNEPVGQPHDGTAPFLWEFSAARALQYDGLDRWTEWDVAGICYCLEKYNGWGYRTRGVNSPYLWSGSDQYKIGKYTSDGRFDPSAKSDEIGGAILLKYFTSNHLVSLEEQPV